MKFSFSRWSFLKSSGFTLVEILVVITIIGIFAAIGMASFGDSKDIAKATKAQSDMVNLHAAMEMLYGDTGRYPNKLNHYCPVFTGSGTNEVDLTAAKAGLVATDGSYSNWNGPYIADATDPWGTPYFLDEDYMCFAEAIGCDGVAGAVSVIASCGEDREFNTGGCLYSDDYGKDNIVHVFCRI